MPKAKRKKPFNCKKAVMDWLAQRGWYVGDVEKRIPTTFISLDLYNCIDLCAVRERDSYKPMFIQVTSRGHMADRMRKAHQQEEFDAILACSEFWVAGVDRPDGETIRIKWLRCDERDHYFEETPK